MGDVVDDADGGTVDFDTESVLTVAELGTRISQLVSQSDAVQGYYVIGEVSDVNPWNGMRFFDLVDETEDATLNCLLFQSVVDEFGEYLEEGALVAVKGHVDFHEPKSAISMQVAEVLPVGDGSREQEKQELIATLREEGLLDDERKQALPPHPTYVGIVTSPSGSAIEDVKTTVFERDRTVELRLHGAKMQGEDAVRTVVEAIQRLDADPEVECIIVTRGGGSDTDLWTFNEEAVARCLAQTATPTVAAIGHEDDTTVTEQVADHRANTPTGAATAAVSEREVVLERFQDLERRIQHGYESCTTPVLGEYERRLSGTYDDVVDDRLKTYERELDAAYEATVTDRVETTVERIDDSYERLVHSRLRSYDERISNAVQAIEHVAKVQQEREAARQEVEQTVTRERVIIVVLVLLLFGLGVAIALGLL